MIRGRVLVDENPDPRGEFRHAHGLSIYIEVGGYRILWDVGPDPEVLRYNAERADISISDVDMVFISHDHADHCGGIGCLRGAGVRIPVYVPFGASDALKEEVRRMGMELREVASPTVISGNVMSIGQLYGPPYEQSLIVLDGMILLLVGCSHPGIVRIVDRAVIFGYRPEVIIGGLHMPSASPERAEEVVRELIRRGVKKIAPIHCSGKAVVEVLRSKYSDYLLKLHVGSEFKI